MPRRGQQNFRFLGESKKIMNILGAFRTFRRCYQILDFRIFRRCGNLPSFITNYNGSFNVNFHFSFNKVYLNICVHFNIYINNYDGVFCPTVSFKLSTIHGSNVTLLALLLLLTRWPSLT